MVTASDPSIRNALTAIAIALVAAVSARESRPQAQPKATPWAEFGVSVAAGSGSLFVAASPQNDGKRGPGTVHVFERGGSGWIESRVLPTPEATVQDLFGVPMATDGNTLVVGAQFADAHGEDSGLAYIFEGRDGNWPRTAVLSASDAAAGDQFGLTVSVSGDRIVVGARLENSRGNAAGAAYVFERRAGAWTQAAKLTASDAVAGDLFGRASIDNGAMIVSADLNDDRGNAAGKAYAFEARGGTWTEVAKLYASDAAARSEFGISLVLKASVAVLGAIGGVNGDNSGAAYVFEQREGQWAQTARLQPIDAGPRQLFGFSVAQSDETIVVGAPTHSGSWQRAGATYVFERRDGDLGPDGQAHRQRRIAWNGVRPLGCHQRRHHRGRGPRQRGRQAPGRGVCLRAHQGLVVGGRQAAAW